MTDAIEWAWTLINLAGVLFLAFVLGELVADLRAASANALEVLGLVNGRRGIWVFVLIRHEAFFLLLQLLFLWAGVAAILRPNTVETDATQFAGLISILFALAMDVVTLLDLRDRARIRNYVAPEQRAK